MAQIPSFSEEASAIFREQRSSFGGVSLASAPRIMSHRTIGASLVCLLGIQGCSGSDEADLAEAERGAARAPFSTSPGEPNHEEITAAGLPFLRPEILVAVQAANVATDAEFFFVNANHFDDCNFAGGSAVVRDSQAEAVVRLDPSAPSPDADLLAIRAFGRSLHAVQDFYAHTNWIELGGDSLVDASLEAFPVFNPYARKTFSKSSRSSSTIDWYIGLRSKCPPSGRICSGISRARIRRPLASHAWASGPSKKAPAKESAFALASR